MIHCASWANWRTLNPVVCCTVMARFLVGALSGDKNLPTGTSHHPCRTPPCSNPTTTPLSNLLHRSPHPPDLWSYNQEKHWTICQTAPTKCPPPESNANSLISTTTPNITNIKCTRKQRHNYAFPTLSVIDRKQAIYERHLNEPIRNPSQNVVRHKN